MVRKAQESKGYKQQVDQHPKIWLTSHFLQGRIRLVAALFRLYIQRNSSHP